MPPASRVLDVGGGTGSWAMALAHADPDLTATVVELAGVAAVAEERIRTAGFCSRITVVAGDLLTDDLPRGHNGFLLADFWTEPTHTQPLPAALMAGEFAIHINDGDVYSFEEAAAWLSATGWAYTGHTPLAGPISLVTAEAA